jgi:hypothetical protein
MGVAEHLKTLCCLGLPPESATIAVSSFLHELLPRGWSRIALLEPDATIGSCYPENPAAATIFRERMWRFIDPIEPRVPLDVCLPRECDRLDFAFERKGLAG